MRIYKTWKVCIVPGLMLLGGCSSWTYADQMSLRCEDIGINAEAGLEACSYVISIGGDPNGGAMPLYRAYGQRAKGYEETGRYQDAINDYNRAVQYSKVGGNYVDEYAQARDAEYLSALKRIPDEARHPSRSSASAAYARQSQYNNCVQQCASHERDCENNADIVSTGGVAGTLGAGLWGARHGYDPRSAVDQGTQQAAADNSTAKSNCESEEDSCNSQCSNMSH